VPVVFSVLSFLQPRFCENQYSGFITHF